MEIKYIDGDLSVHAGTLFIMPKIYPSKEIEIKLRNYTLKAIRREEKLLELEKLKKRKKEKGKKLSAAEKAASDAGLGNDLKEIAAIIKFFWNLTSYVIERTGKWARVYIKMFYISVGAENSASTAVLYGIISQSASYFMKYLENNIDIKYKKNIQAGVYADFNSCKVEANLDIVIKFRTIHLLIVFINIIIKYFSENKIKN